MTNITDNTEMVKKINVLRVMDQRGIEVALRLYPEDAVFIYTYANVDYEVAKNEILNEPHAKFEYAH